MTERQIQDFHAHIYFDPEELEQAKALGAAACERFGVPVGGYHLAPVGPHPRGSCQLTVTPEQFGDFARWMVLNRGGLTPGQFLDRYERSGGLDPDANYGGARSSGDGGALKRA